MPLAPGYGFKTIRANILTMLREGRARANAIAAAHREARAAFWRRHPDGILPYYIYPERGAKDRHRPRDPHRPRARKNPISDLDPVDVNKGLKLFEKFTGSPAGKRQRMIPRPELPDALVCIGDISLIRYVAERDGETFEFEHPFRARSRPLLCVTPDGKLVLALGGAWTFTEDGFVDT
jgi:hypothetical protein